MSTSNSFAKATEEVTRIPDGRTALAKVWSAALNKWLWIYLPTNSLAEFDAATKQVLAAFDDIRLFDFFNMPGFASAFIPDARKYVEILEIAKRERPELLTGGWNEETLTALWRFVEEGYGTPEQAVRSIEGKIPAPETYAEEAAENAGGVYALIGDRVNEYIDFKRLGEELLLEEANTDGGRRQIEGYFFEAARRGRK